ncbi:hypothetical protein OSH93_24795, partial [Mycobacterium ulcerans]
PPPRPPQSTIPQLTSLLINNAGALPSARSVNRRLFRVTSISHSSFCRCGELVYTCRKANSETMRPGPVI